MYDYKMREKIYQKFILGARNSTTPLQKGLGGIIFFTKDIESREQFISLINRIKSEALISPFLSIDQEGGRVERTENIRPRRLSARHAYEKGGDFLKKQSCEISKELFEYGINLNFAPCIDVNTNPNNPIIGERSFSNNPVEVIEAMDIFCKASREFKIIPCVKHYPGHGDADKDSHLDLPKIDLSFEEMLDAHIKPFKYAVDKNIEMIMVAHLHCTCFDKTPIPTSLSKNAIGFLRKNLNYNGVLISDDMVMKGVQDYGSLEACIMGIEAGLDMFIFRDADSLAIETIENLYKEVQKSKYLQKLVKESYQRIINLKHKYHII